MSKQSTTLQDLYKHYNYPCWDIELLKTNTVPVPYIPKDKLQCNHKFTLTYDDWRKIVLTLFENLFILLMSGISIKLPHRLGFIQMKKRKADSIDKPYLAKTGKIRKIKHTETGGFKPILKWNRFNTSAHFSFKTFWKINLVRGRWKDIIENVIKKDFSQINKLIEV